MNRGTALRIPLGRTTEQVKYVRRSAEALQVERPGGARICINETQVLGTGVAR